MKCHSNKEGGNPLKHMLHMVLCCGLPIVIIFMLPFIATLSPGIASILAIIAPFICPIMMGLMLLGMFMGKRKDKCCTNAKDENSN